MNLAASLQRDVEASNDDIIIAGFIRHLEHKQFTWRRFYRMKFSQASTKKRWESQFLFVQSSYYSQQNTSYTQSNAEYRQRDFYVNNQGFNFSYRNDRRSNNNFRYDNNARNDRNYGQANRGQYQVSAS